ncbi:casein kinase 1, delta [Pochonia chlamydosporia 170]|uniref:non-specific serine/threonine protein kinase n=1 Tax=Pochonia chlamydosporia 170 TaxID=1380566 RepID=A0A179F412_METCM|nr:casein kinase 1, delta [Pochonia chlamydosporia 170]OAQ60167.1 casein kinase 1, delta [Pochonia chlamydosporia 170]
MKDILVNKRYRVDYKIGEGGFGLVYAGTDIETKHEVAIKLTHVRDGPEALKYEADAYATLSRGVGIPRFLWYGEEGEFYVLVHELLGLSLEDLFEYCNRKFSLKTVLLIADQAVRRIKYIHTHGYLHCDIKPENFLMGNGKNGNVLYTIDFGLARDFDASEGHGVRDDRPFGGTARYATLRNHSGLEQSRADDLESLGYVLVYLARGSLPWQGLKASTEKELAELIKQKKASKRAKKTPGGTGSGQNRVQKKHASSGRGQFFEYSRLGSVREGLDGRIEFKIYWKPTWGTLEDLRGARALKEAEVLTVNYYDQDIWDEEMRKSGRLGLHTDTE